MSVKIAHQTHLSKRAAINLYTNAIFLLHFRVVTRSLIVVTRRSNSSTYRRRLSSNTPRLRLKRGLLLSLHQMLMPLDTPRFFASNRLPSEKFYRTLNITQVVDGTLATLPFDCPSRFPRDDFLLAPARLTDSRVFVSALRVNRYGRYCRGVPPGSGLVHIYYISITRDAILRYAAAVPILNYTRDNPLFIVRLVC